MTGPGNAPAGWYDDGSGTGTRRYWDGAAWTEHTAPAEPSAAPSTETPAVGEPVATATQPYGAAAMQSADPSYATTETSGYAPAGATGAPSAPDAAPNRKPHVLGIVALVVAAIGFVFACIPGALIVGWVLLPIAFILSLVALFLKGAKWPAITGLIVSVVGTIVGVVVFVTVVSTSFTEAFGDIDGAIAEASEAAEEAIESELATEEPVPEAPGTLEFGDTLVYDDNIELTVSAPEPYTPSEFAAGADQAANIAFTITITNNSTENLDPLPFPQLSSGGQEASQIFDVSGEGGQVGLPPTNVLLPGQSVTWISAWSVADPNSLTLQVSPGFAYQDAIYTNAQ